MKLGNVIEFIAKYTGLRWFVRLFIEECGCKERKDRWNNWKFKNPFKRKPKKNKTTRDA